MRKEKRLFTSESVSEGHPDKVADQISDALLDAILAKDPNGRVACETTVTTGLVLVVGEISTSAYVDIQSVVRKTILEIGYNRPELGFDGNNCALSLIHIYFSGELRIHLMCLLILVPSQVQNLHLQEWLLFC